MKSLTLLSDSYGFKKLLCGKKPTGLAQSSSDRDLKHLSSSLEIIKEVRQQATYVILAYIFCCQPNLKVKTTLHNRIPFVCGTVQRLQN